MNWYYELKPGTKVLGQDFGQYIVMPDCSPAQGGNMIYTVHDQALQVSSRAWLENANGVTILEATPSTSGGVKWAAKTTVSENDLREFTWIKLKASSVK